MITRWYHEDSIEYLIASTYATGKGRLFEMFCGWRGTHNHECKMVFSANDWKNIDESIEYYNKFVAKKEK